jgi:hypothetical protein
VELLFSPSLSNAIELCIFSCLVSSGRKANTKRPIGKQSFHPCRRRNLGSAIFFYINLVSPDTDSVLGAFCIVFYLFFNSSS